MISHLMNNSILLLLLMDTPHSGRAGRPWTAASQPSQGAESRGCCSSPSYPPPCTCSEGHTIQPSSVIHSSVRHPSSPSSSIHHLSSFIILPSVILHSSSIIYLSTVQPLIIQHHLSSIHHLSCIRYPSSPSTSVIIAHLFITRTHLHHISSIYHPSSLPSSIHYLPSMYYLSSPSSSYYPFIIHLAFKHLIYHLSIPSSSIYHLIKIHPLMFYLSNLSIHCHPFIIYLSILYYYSPNYHHLSTI